ncbi:RNA polymerase sigma factor [Luteimonas aquatica]|uniref:RNA polymerase sigma factor n=1 Tax=Luteimonas aquatica TaxID=450364 RepID=UPI001F5884EB|nr:sigma-70 family RNA polymerase sigma factor [Luteimonas aquatica]
MPSPLDDWFKREILVHEAALAGYLRRCWPHADELHDLRQEIYVRVYEAAGKALPGQPKSFLFATARHLMTDRLRRSRVVSIEAMGDIESLNVLVDEVSPERWCGGRQTLKQLAEAFDRLPDRCREVFWLRRVEELPQKEVAMRLGISEKTVEKHIARGMRLLADHFYSATPDPPAVREARRDIDQGRNGQQAD